MLKSNPYSSSFDITKVRNDFPILQTELYGKPLVYLDNAATTQKPNSVIEAMDDYYRNYNSNVHRGVHALSQRATDAFEVVRKKVQNFINSKEEYEVIFTKGTTESINLVATSFGKRYISAGDSILISAMEHHSNIVPWQMMAEERGAKIKVIPINQKGELILSDLHQLLDETVKLVALTYISNTLGTINPVEEIILQAHQRNIPVMLDAAQAAPHLKLDVQELDVDFLAFSGHKMFGPTAIGILYGKEKFLNEMPPYQGGGEMIKTVTLEKTTYNVLPFKFEAGTPGIAEVIGLGAAIDYINSVGRDNIIEAENILIKYALDELQNIKELRFIGEAEKRSGSISFLLAQHHPFDVGELLDKQSIAVRTGNHCTEPLMSFFSVPGTVRASFAFYNTTQEIDKLIIALKKAIQILS